MLRNGCLNLIHFRIPADVINEYSRLADILLYIVTAEDDEFVQRLGNLQVGTFVKFMLKLFFVIRNLPTKRFSMSSGWRTENHCRQFR